MAAKPPVGDAAVRKATGRDWKGWIALLDGLGARSMSHRDIAMMVWRDHKLSPWWSQAVTVGYERLLGKRAVGQTATGFVAGVSRTLDAPLEAVVAAWTALGEREPADGTKVHVFIEAVTAGRTKVIISQEKLPDARTHALRKRYWSDVLDRLQEDAGRR